MDHHFRILPQAVSSHVLFDSAGITVLNSKIVFNIADFI